MKNLNLLIILIVILALATFSQESFFNKSEEVKKQTTPNPTSYPSPTLTPTSTVVNQTKNNSTVQSTPSPVSSANNTMYSVGSFIYPGSAVSFQTEDKLSLQSFDDSSRITDWYKEKITSLNMKAKSFVQTSSNRNILNKLAGANSLLKVNVEISKKNSDSKTEITVYLEK
ncbi:MAG: hypothetical protein A2629_00330 [Candidatus Levybacteria bacterium RIFCSPHIGHO2_01_FULL_41_15]|nr:MAG: hypothetical protein A2629_00330 [Candidatus Levybacteria bacterium RIFCSPHIGHO2_01_FULL_41_15]